MYDIAEANRMLDTFVSVGTATFDVTFLDIDGEKRGFRPRQTAGQIRNSLPKLIPGLQERQQNIIVRPNCDKAQLVQLDDLDSPKLQHVEPVAFVTLQTSPGNHQAWVAVSDAGRDAKDFARRLRKGTGADPTASGATRCAGTPNFKVKYRPEFPTVSIVHAIPGRSVTRAQLESLGLVAAPEPVVAKAPLRVSEHGRQWPDYQKAVKGAPLNNGNTGPDISRADFFWCMLAAQRNFTADEIAAELGRLSCKAEENGERYCRLTAENACEAADRGRRSRA